MKTYLRHRIQNVVDVKELIALEYLDFEGKYKDYRESHGFWELCFVQSGEILVNVENTITTLKENQLFLIAPDKTHAYTSNNGNQNKAFVICFESFSQAVKSLENTHFKTDEREQLILKTIISECNHTFFMNGKDLLETVSQPNFGGGQVITVQLEYLLINLIRRLSATEDKVVFLSGERFHSDLVRVIINYFNENVDSKLTLDEICGKVNYSRSLICKIFKEQTGETLLNYFNRLKTERAKRLLIETDLSATKISERLGFAEPKYFGAVFKKYTGTTPIAYRKEKYGKTD